MKKVLVTGANGFVGKSITCALQRFFSVHCLVRDRAFTCEGARVHYFLRYDDPSVEEAVAQSDAIVHCAAMLHGRKDLMHAANVGFTKLLLGLSERHGVRHFVYISTENVLQDLSDTYTQTKMEAETLVKKFENHTILRPTVIYGPGDKKYVSRLISLVNKLPFAPILGRGTNRFQFLYIDDLAHVVYAALSGKIFGCYLVAGPESITYNEFMDLLRTRLGVSKPSLRLPLPVLRPLAYLLENISTTPPLTRTQLDNLQHDRNYDIGETVNAFEYMPTSLDEGLRTLIDGGKTDE